MISAIDNAAPNHIIANCGCVMCVSFIRPPCQEVIEKAESIGTRLLILYVPYVGIIQIRLWVKAIAYSQPTLVSTPLWVLLYELNCKWSNVFLHILYNNAITKS